MTTLDDKLLDRKPRGVNLAEKATHFYAYRSSTFKN
jgi:DNA-binding transcriptional LysR family regulator